ncbi:uncharacterized protein LOC123587988 [Leopardus geoffroyi]|uniref:uncharacterized protein LOC123587988 n=1 Tax=Leopardus geoffroyi TaxID=46844 RepID=UPI001E264A09|nr:uncharacterized protein LOC123587988 [Leopardus geoffroyi]
MQPDIPPLMSFLEPSPQGQVQGGRRGALGGGYPPLSSPPLPSPPLPGAGREGFSPVTLSVRFLLFLRFCARPGHHPPRSVLAGTFLGEDETPAPASSAARTIRTVDPPLLLGSEAFHPFPLFTLSASHLGSAKSRRKGPERTCLQLWWPSGLRRSPGQHVNKRVAVLQGTLRTDVGRGWDSARELWFANPPVSQPPGYSRRHRIVWPMRKPRLTERPGAQGHGPRLRQVQSLDLHVLRAPNGHRSLRNPHRCHLSLYGENPLAHPPPATTSPSPARGVAFPVCQGDGAGNLLLALLSICRGLLC